jgi:hypothetical protein
MQTFATEVDLRLAAQRALLDEVPPRLRSVSFDLAGHQRLRARFEFDGEPTDDELECARIVMTNILASLGSPQCYVEDFVGNRFPSRRNHLPIIVYARNEDLWNSWVTGAATT